MTASVSPKSVTPGHKVTYDAKVSASGGVPNGGTVEFKIGSKRICGAKLQNGEASCESTAVPIGRDKVVADHDGTAMFGASSSTPVLDVAKPKKQHAHQGTR